MEYVLVVLSFTTMAMGVLWIALVAIHRKKIEEIDAIALGPDYKIPWAPLYLLRSIQYGFGSMSKTLAARHPPYIDYGEIPPETLRPIRTTAIVYIVCMVSMFGTIAVHQLGDFKVAS